MIFHIYINIFSEQKMYKELPEQV